MAYGRNNIIYIMSLRKLYEKFSHIDDNNNNNNKIN